MTAANRILKAAIMACDKCACDCEGCRDYFRPIVVAVLRELAKNYDEYTEGVIGDELSDLADEIEGNSDD